MNYLYTNLFIKPNLKNIRVEWLDLLLDKLRKYNTSLNINNQMTATIESIKWQCVIENTKLEAEQMAKPLNNNFEAQLNNVPKTQPNNNVVNQSVDNFSTQINSAINTATDNIFSGIDQINNMANSKPLNKVPKGYTGINFNL